MKNLKIKFEKIYSKYQSKKDFLNKTISRWQSKGKINLYNQGSQLTKNIERLVQELNTLFIQNQPQQNTKIINSKIKELKADYKKLNEITKNILRQWIEAIVFAGSLVFILKTFLFGLYHVPSGSAEPTILIGDRIWGNKIIYFFKEIKRGEYIIFDNPEFSFDKSNYINYLWQKYAGIPIPLLGLGTGPDNITKRVIAVSGDTIEGRVENDKTVIYVNGQKLDETAYVNPYPLIKIKKTIGLINLEYFGPFQLPFFINKKQKLVDYTYDPSKSFDNQPYYSMTQDDVIRGYDGSTFLRMPYSPTYEYDRQTGEATRSIDSFGPIKVPAGKYWVMGDSRKNSYDSRYWGFLDESLIHGRASFITHSIDSEEPFWLLDLIEHPIDFWVKLTRWNRFFTPIKHIDPLAKK